METQLRKQTPRKLSASKPNLTGIPTQMKLDFERRSGLPFDDVRVHYNSDKPIRFGAGAYTYGTDVYIAPGQNDVLRHELGHVIQHKRGIGRRDTTENGVPVSNAPGIEKQADEFGTRFLPKTAPEPLGRPKKISPVVMKGKILPGMRISSKKLPKMEPFIRRQRDAKWRPDKRSRTAYGITNGTTNQGPHTIPYITNEVFRRALIDGRVDLGRFAGTRLLPKPDTASRIMKRLIRLETLDGKIQRVPSIMSKLNTFNERYAKLYRARRWREVFELHPTRTYALFRPATHTELKGKGERRNQAVDDLLNRTVADELDLPDRASEPNTRRYLEHKGKKMAKSMEAVVHANGDTDLSEDSEA